MRLLCTLFFACAMSLSSICQTQSVFDGAYVPLSSQNAGDSPFVVINELDADQPGGDTMEFIELFGTPNAALTNLTLVFFNGSDDASYAAIDLSGVVLDEDGFALVGNDFFTDADATFSNGLLQNGPDAVAIMIGTELDYPNDTPIDVNNIIDAVVHLTSDNIDDGLMILLNAGQLSVDEALGGGAAINSLSRVPDGGIARNTDTYVTQIPTPGSTNVLLCDGGTIGIVDSEETSIELCVDLALAEVTFSFETSVPGASYSFIITDADDIIIGTSESSTIDFAGIDPGTCYVHGISFTGELDAATLVAGNNINDVVSTECSNSSLNAITVVKIDCSAPTCSPGEVTLIDGQTSGAICVNGEGTILEFSHTTTEESYELLYVLATIDDEIVAVSDEPLFDFLDQAVGDCRLYGFVFQGNLDEASTEVDLPISGISATLCGELTPGFVEIQKLECNTEGGCSDLYISEYLEGTSQNKAIEIYNPTPFDVNLSEYTISTYNNGNTSPTNQQVLSGTLTSEDVYVITHSDASALILAEADESSGISWFNGNDAIALYHNDVLIDILGVIGEDPGESTPWDVNGVEFGMAEHTLVRNPLINSGETDWLIGQSQWDVYPQNTFDFIGSHTATPCNFDETPTVSFVTQSLVTQEGNMVSVNVSVAFPISEVEAEINLVGGSADDVLDFDNIFPIIVTFEEGVFTPQNVQFMITEDLLPEGAETIDLELTALTPDVEVAISELTITILASDQEIPVVDISDVNTEDPLTGVADSLNLLCELRGIVHGLNTFPDGFQFTLIDETGGINVFNGANDFGYTVTEGDSVHVSGLIDQFEGLTQIVADTLQLQGSGYDLMEPLVVTELNEETESQLLTLRCVSLIDTSQWVNSGVGFNVQVSDGTSVYEMRIDADVDIFGTAVPLGSFTVIGIGGQFDSSEPFDEGYQISPRYLQDLTDPLISDFTAPDVWNLLDGGVDFVNTSDGAFSYDWDFGDNENSINESPNHVYEEPGIYTVSLTAFSEDGLCSDTRSVQIDLQIISVEELAAMNIHVYPNPSNGQFSMEGLEDNSLVKIYNQQGQLVFSDTANSDRLVIDTPQLAKGLYFIEVSTANQRWAVRHIIK